MIPQHRLTLKGTSNHFFNTLSNVQCQDLTTVSAMSRPDTIKDGLSCRMEVLPTFHTGGPSGKEPMVWRRSLGSTPTENNVASRRSRGKGRSGRRLTLRPG